jgi:hypothetical protein
LLLGLLRGLSLRLLGRTLPLRLFLGYALPLGLLRDLSLRLRRTRMAWP